MVNPAVPSPATASATLPRRKRPSIGFVAVVATYLAAGGFVLWGLSTPPLDRVWVLHHELKIGLRGAPSADDTRLLRAALRRHRGLAHALLPDGEGDIGLLSKHADGWLATPEATLLRAAGARQRELRIEIGTPLDLLPFTIEVEGDRFEQRLTAREHGVLTLMLPAAKDHAELFIVRLRGKKLRSDPSVLNLRLTVGSQEHPS